MAGYVLSEQAAKQLADTVRAVARNEPSRNLPPQRRKVVDELFVTGKIDGTLAVNGTATLSIYKPSTSGGIGTDTTINVKVVDGGKLSATLAASTVVDAAYTRGVWLVIGWKCP